MVLVVVDEYDIVCVCINVCGEDDYFYLMMLECEMMCVLFFFYVEVVNWLVECLVFYNIIMLNCIMLVYCMVC